MVVIAGGILLAVFVLMVIFGLALLARDGVRAAKRNARGIGIAVMGVVALAAVFGIITAIGAAVPKPRAPVVRQATGFDWSDKPIDMVDGNGHRACVLNCPKGGP